MSLLGIRRLFLVKLIGEVNKHPMWLIILCSLKPTGYRIELIDGSSDFCPHQDATLFLILIFILLKSPLSHHALSPAGSVSVLLPSRTWVPGQLWSLCNVETPDPFWIFTTGPSISMESLLSHTGHLRSPS